MTAYVILGVIAVAAVCLMFRSILAEFHRWDKAGPAGKYMKQQLEQAAAVVTDVTVNVETADKAGFPVWPGIGAILRRDFNDWFDVRKKPPSAAAIKNVLLQVKFIETIVVIFAMLWLVAGAWPTTTYVWDAFAELREAVSDSFVLEVVIKSGGALAAFVAAIGPFALFSGVYGSAALVEKVVSPLHATLAERVIQLSAKHPEVDAYRTKVVTSRAITNGDLSAMSRFEADTRVVVLPPLPPVSPHEAKLQLIHDVNPICQAVT